MKVGHREPRRRTKGIGITEFGIERKRWPTVFDCGKSKRKVLTYVSMTDP